MITKTRSLEGPTGSSSKLGNAKLSVLLLIALRRITCDWVPILTDEVLARVRPRLWYSSWALAKGTWVDCTEGRGRGQLMQVHPELLYSTWDAATRGEILGRLVIRVMVCGSDRTWEVGWTLGLWRSRARGTRWRVGACTGTMLTE